MAVPRKGDELKAELHRIGLPPRAFENDLVKIYEAAAQQFDEATAKIDATTLLAKGPAGAIVPSPLLQIRDQAGQTMLRVGRELGLSADHRVAPAMPTWSEFAIALHD